MLETLIVTHSKGSLYTSNRDVKKTNDTFNTRTVHSHLSTNKPHEQNKRKTPCLKCNANHPLYSCQQFLNSHLDDKLRFINDNKLCHNCLHSGHTANTCRYGSCRKCNIKHNTIIHHDGESMTNEEQNTSTVAHSEPAHTQAQLNSRGTHPKDVQCTHTSSSVQNVLLSTAVIEICDNIGYYHKARVLLDSGSQRSFITHSLCKRLNLPLIQSTQQIRGIGNVITQSTQTCNVLFRCTVGSYTTRIPCLVLSHITSTLPSIPAHNKLFNIPSHIVLADPSFYEGFDIDMLLGADIFWDLLNKGKIRLSNGPFLQETKLGWIISGPIFSEMRDTEYINCNFTEQLDNIDKQLRKFWELEEFPTKVGLLSDDEKACENHFTQTTTRKEDGRFCVSIPFKLSPDGLGETFSQAVRRFISLERRLQKSDSYKQMYTDFIREYIRLGHMNQVHTYKTPHYFMPHHGVFREHSTTTKLRVVFDASALSSTNKSLNDLQMVGPPIQGDLIAILLRFREYQFVACADIEKMYRQILLNENQRDLQLIIWRDNPSDPLQIYKLNTVTYGTASAPYLSVRCLKQLAIECSEPEVARTIKNDFYVDDLITSQPLKNTLVQICDKTTRVLASGCLPLRKWVFNFDSDNSNSQTVSKDLGADTPCKMLGLGWYNTSDQLHFHTQFKINSNQVTKRTILSNISQIYDPLGLLSPTIILIKVLLQRLWLLKLDWDEPVPTDVLHTWNQFVNNLFILNNLRVHRHAICIEPKRIEIHIFTDASQIAYGACAYIRSISNDGIVTVRLLCAKGKVAPLKPVSIPRLELCGALLGARLYCKITESLRSKPDISVFWTDSTIVLGWLRMTPNLLKTFVQNRIVEIHDLTKGTIWRHVRGKNNPADLVSRGMSLEALSSSMFWWEGPEFLRDPNLDSTRAESDPHDYPTQDNMPEVKVNNVHSLYSSQNPHSSLFPYDRFSQFSRINRTAAYVLRFIHNARNKTDRRLGALSVNELKDSVNMLARLAQRESFPDEYCALFNNKKLKNKNSLNKLNLFLDADKIARVGGRLENSLEFDFNKKHPILISAKHHFTYLLFHNEHKRLLHAGPQTLLFSLREMWWPIGGRNLAKTVVHKCVTCTRFRGKTITPLMGNLPQQRLAPGFPFIQTGVDYAGPVFILNRKGRGAQTTKSYICLFICLVTRAVHLELVSDLSTDAYLLALKRFISRRGKPIEIMSDNGKNFVGLMGEFAKVISNCSPDIVDYASSQDIKFKFIPPYAPHFGGLWEAGVRSCKHHLRRVVGNAHLTYEEFSTVLSQVEAVLNSRPLSPMSTDPNDLIPLTPAHFLVGRPLTAPATADLQSTPTHRLTRYKMFEQIRQHLWSRWLKKYIQMEY